MSKKKENDMATEKEPGRPLGRKYPPRIDATPEEIALVFLRTPTSEATNAEHIYRCVGCNREVYYPETLYRDGKCESCTTTGG